MKGRISKVQDKMNGLEKHFVKKTEDIFDSGENQEKKVEDKFEKEIEENFLKRIKEKL